MASQPSTLRVFDLSLNACPIIAVIKWNNMNTKHYPYALHTQIILYIIKVGLSCRGYTTWLHQIVEILLIFYIFKELKMNSILPGL